jgi:hypothetical protein
VSTFQYAAAVMIASHVAVPTCPSGYCLAAVPLIRARGARRGSAAALGVWALIAAAGYGLVLS